MSYTGYMSYKVTKAGGAELSCNSCNKVTL